MFDWKPGYALGFGTMDETHREFVLLVGALLASVDADVPAALDRLEDHLQRHFNEERQWMASTDFPSASCHLDEHAAVLKSVAEVQVVVRAGRVSVARELAAELARWFPEHTEAMDMGLAKWMVKLKLGGAPVMIRRGAARPAGGPSVGELRCCR